MRIAWVLAAVSLAAIPSAAIQAQATNDSGVRTETQERIQAGSFDIPWLDLIGLVGLLGLLGLRRPHAEDSYHPAPVE